MRWMLGLAFLLIAGEAMAANIPIVAAENFYGDVAAELGGPDVAVASILENPDQDPHLFEASPSVARRLATARIVILNGAEYDPWMDSLLAAHDAPGRIVIRVADLLGRHSGDNPHLWYDPAAMPAVARALTAALDQIDPGATPAHRGRLAAFLQTLAPLQARVAAIRAAHAGMAVTATEPVFGEMAAALGLVMRNEAFQRAVMNDSEPAPSDVAAFEADLRQHRVAVLLYNSQATNTAAQRLLGVAKQVGVPVVGVTETEPPGTHYVPWMLAQLDALERALSVRAGKS